MGHEPPEARFGTKGPKLENKNRAHGLPKMERILVGPLWVPHGVVVCGPKLESRPEFCSKYRADPKPGLPSLPCGALDFRCFADFSLAANIAPPASALERAATVEALPAQNAGFRTPKICSDQQASRNGSRIELQGCQYEQNTQQNEPDTSRGVLGPERGPNKFETILPTSASKEPPSLHYVRPVRTSATTTDALQECMCRTASTSKQPAAPHAPLYDAMRSHNDATTTP
jgi:hypothetical protein